MNGIFNIKSVLFLRFITRAVDTKSAEYRELYHFLLKTFQVKALITPRIP